MNLADFATVALLVVGSFFLGSYWGQEQMRERIIERVEIATNELVAKWGTE